MFRSIQVRSNYRIDRINEHGAVDSSKREDGNINALLKSGNTHSAPFGGFIEAGNLIGLPKVKLANIAALCEDLEADKPTYNIPKDHFVVGTYLEQRLFILLKNGEPQHFIDHNVELEGKNTVVSLF
ncbi:hypothetical protein [Vibrio cionasavignyae]|uniref:hypothetical protein n=1 Tax=Vibrio cionasavignyae TaxID=2910252 RepID=UPI003D114677